MYTICNVFVIYDVVWFVIVSIDLYVYKKDKFIPHN